MQSVVILGMEYAHLDVTVSNIYREAIKYLAEQGFDTELLNTKQQGEILHLVSEGIRVYQGETCLDRVFKENCLA